MDSPDTADSRTTLSWPAPHDGPLFWTPPTPPPRSAWNRWGRHLLLFVLTATTVWLSGGWPLAIGLLSILLAHEMGHYLACRYYGVDATLPFFIPAPPVLVGTFGAMIRIRSPIPHRRALFDIGIAGPLAGFFVCLPVLVIGVLEASVQPTPPDDGLSLSFGEPLLFRWVTLLLKGTIPDDNTLFIGSWGLAAWFGLFVTALNLIPVGQLDGGHVIYALFRSRAQLISRLGFAGCVGLIYFGPNWLIWSILLLVIGRRHPPTLNDDAPLGRGRVWVGLLGLVVFIVCFVPDPILGSWDRFHEAFAALTEP